MIIKRLQILLPCTMHTVYRMCSSIPILTFRAKLLERCNGIRACHYFKIQLCTKGSWRSCTTCGTISKKTAVVYEKFNIAMSTEGRPQWPRGLRHELSSLARKLGSWVRIPLKAWMPVCAYSVFVLFRV
jgi:hypothetical protein